ncbi:hypothetical protein WMY93_028124 [Mugilogobius chulae]|uniref:WD repeat domain 74 n=1 Tax=Mugilogobius chulae TaxID=88201 RepID=A0AAW0MR23_9GOBI
MLNEPKRCVRTPPSLTKWPRRKRQSSEDLGPGEPGQTRLQRQEPARQLAGPAAASLGQDMAFLPGSAKVVTCTGFHQVHIFDPSSPRRRPVLEAHRSGEHAGQVALLDLRKGLVRGVLKGATGSIRALQCHQSLPLVASCGLDRFLRIHSLSDRKLQHKVYLKSRLNCLLFSSSDPNAEAKPLKVKEEEEEREEEDEVWDRMESVHEAEEEERKENEEGEEEEESVNEAEEERKENEEEEEERINPEENEEESVKPEEEEKEATVKTKRKTDTKKEQKKTKKRKKGQD